MQIPTYHGTAGPATPHVGICLTRDDEAAATYATAKNAGATVTEIILETTGLTGVDVDYDFDSGEPIIPDDLDADYIEFVDSGMDLRDHDTIMLLTERAVAACTVTEAREVETA